jgi:outer membrane cobalamin receptor
MCKRILFLFLLIIFLKWPSNAQKLHTDCIVKGIVKSQSGTPIQWASVRLVDASDTSKIQMALTLPDGGFQFKSSCNHMRLTITMTGYEPYTHQINPAEDSSLLEVGLTAKFQNLTSVEVRASRRNFEVRNDRIIINVEAVASNAGANIMEVLEKSPGIAVDQDGVVSIQGKQGVLILIDGKRNQLHPAELAAFLRSLSSAQVDQIELITQPSAQYDATGNAGVINIRMKRSKTANFNGNITSAITQGRYTRFNQSIALDQRIGKAIFSLGYTGAYLKGFYDFSITRRFANNTTHSTDYFEQHTFNPFRQIPHNVRFNMDYALGKKTSIALNNTLFVSSYKDVPGTQGFYDNGDSRNFEQSIGSNHIRQLN